MGWCSGTQVFDDVMDAVVEYVADESVRHDIARHVAASLWENDWDCEEDSLYYEEYLVPLMLEKGYLNPEDA